MSSISRNHEIRKNVFFNRFVIFSSARGRRPSDFKSGTKNPNPSSSSSCPFCIGREHECAPEIFRIPRDSSDWKVRVIENLYPALLPDPNLLEPNPNPDTISGGFGYHNVVIETPRHHLRLSDLSADEIRRVLVACKERIQQLQSDEAIKYVQLFKNHGASAGASMSHSHSQLMGLPFIPPTVSDRIDSMKEYFNRGGKCGVCDIEPGELMIEKSTHFFSMIPFAASFPFEIWIIPRHHSSHFHELDDEKWVDLGRLLKLMLTKLSQQLNDPPFNFMVHTSPFRAPVSELLYTHWFLQIVPKLGSDGGFEIGSGCYINPVFPEDAAKVLRETIVSTYEQ